MQQTTGQLKLSKIDLTDVPDITVLNPNFDKLDTEITKLKNDKVDKVSGKSLSTNDYTSEEKTKLANVAQNANNYTHPSSHPPSIIVQDVNNRLVTDSEKSTWNSKAPTTPVTTSVNGLMSKEDKTKLDGVATGANRIILNNTVTSTSTTEGATANVVKVVNDTLSTHSSNTTSHVTANERTTWSGKASTSVVTTTTNGLMSSADKTKIDRITNSNMDSIINKWAYSYSATTGSSHRLKNANMINLNYPVASYLINVTDDSVLLTGTYFIESDSGVVNVTIIHPHSDIVVTDEEGGIIIRYNGTPCDIAMEIEQFPIWYNGINKNINFADGLQYKRNKIYHTGNKPTATDIGAIPTTASCNKNWQWSGQSGQPTWLWGGNDITNMYVYNPANFNVNSATFVQGRNLVQEVDDLKQSVGNGKNEFASTITGKGLSANGSDTFTALSSKVTQMELGSCRDFNVTTDLPATGNTGATNFFPLGELFASDVFFNYNKGMTMCQINLYDPAYQTSLNVTTTLYVQAGKTSYRVNQGGITGYIYLEPITTNGVNQLVDCFRFVRVSLTNYTGTYINANGVLFTTQGYERHSSEVSVPQI